MGWGSGNLGGGGSGKLFAAIGVTYPEGSTLTCTDGKKALKAKTTTGLWLFSIPYAGTWTVTSTDPTGENEPASKTVEITTEGQSVSVELSYDVFLSDGSTEYVKGSATTVTYSDNKWTISNGAGSASAEYMTFTQNVTDLISQYLPKATEVLIEPLNLTGDLKIYLKTGTGDNPGLISTLPATLVVSGLPAACYIGTDSWDNHSVSFSDIKISAVK